jgi:hypothetical protein
MIVMFSAMHWVSTSVTLECLEDLPAIVKIKLMKTLKWRLIAHQFNTVCSVGMVKSVETKEECCWPVCGQV